MRVAGLVGEAERIMRHARVEEAERFPAAVVPGESLESWLSEGSRTP
jgi:hypothetical protein